MDSFQPLGVNGVGKASSVPQQKRTGSSDGVGFEDLLSEIETNIHEAADEKDPNSTEYAALEALQEELYDRLSPKAQAGLEEKARNLGFNNYGFRS